MTAVAPPAPQTQQIDAGESALAHKPWFFVLRDIRRYVGRIGRYEVLAAFRSYHDAEIFAVGRANTSIVEVTPLQAAQSMERGYHDITTA